ncbi:alpha/beta hydrolase [Methylovulum sp.]|uniref:alpha/beta fold hydrolase n=1 Tax=Methylovulum sp. TaxID=1916980 RepID=UPI00260E7DF6|nr:alpha/beta hydrolase [Methylovulum sp.]MDD2801119.1 alpha/beta hydrolase [Methylococcales bacterium]MDD5126075.1 alpha/beta hydrolase [Methylovulum sp.]
MKIVFVTIFCLLISVLPAFGAELPKGASSHFAQVNGIRIHYVKMGEGPLVLLLHGWPQTWYEWRHTMPKLANNFTVVAPDLRGLGESELANDGYDKSTIAEDITALIRHFDVGKAVVVGHDMGGKTAYLLSLIHPDVVEKLVLVDCMLPGTENMDPVKGGMWHYGFHMAAEFPELLTQGKEREYITAQMTQWLHRKDAISEEAIAEYASHYASPGGMTAGFNYYRTLRDDAKVAASLANQKLSMPVLTIGGRYSVSDKLFQALRSQAVNITGVIAEHSGHFVPEEEADFFVNELERFLRQ